MSESPIGSSAHSTNSGDSSGPSQPQNGSPLPSSSPDHPSENVDVADEFCSDQVGEDNSPEAKLRSKYWAHYKRVKINGEWKACCKYCPAKISRKTENGTSHLQQHYNRKHLKKESMRQQVRTNNFMNRGRPMEITSYSFDQGTARKELANVIIMHEYPLSIVEHVGFRRLALRNWLYDENAVVREMTKRMVDKFDKYWAVIHSIVGVSSVLDPRYKLNVLEFYFSKLFPESFIEEVEKVRALCYKLLKDYRNPSSMMEGIGEASSGYTTIYDDSETGESCVTCEVMSS
ncbi:hypothetical protein Vadar_019524 [Vaccinium darrowii]|uniref:Uncharacterized protein n=1 Tax=Vaccinium darrowii TaxID=229202 RepID=A0ACB7Y8D8_9ERIC|nr:hypothetical protein Vadar_019524 [Vaccinium darrowii]